MSFECGSIHQRSVRIPGGKLRASTAVFFDGLDQRLFFLICSFKAAASVVIRIMVSADLVTSRKGEKIKQLYEGDTSEYGGDDSSADLAWVFAR